MKKFRITDQNKKKVGLAITIAIVVFLVLVCIVVGIPLLKFAKDPERFRIWVDSLGVWGYLAFIGILVFQIIFAFIPGEPFELLAGYAFGALEGTLLCMAGILIGSLLVFTLTKKFGVKLVELFFSMDKIRSLKFLHNKQRMYFISRFFYSRNSKGSALLRSRAYAYQARTMAFIKYCSTYSLGTYLYYKRRCCWNTKLYLCADRFRHYRCTQYYRITNL